ncbi:CP2 transcription factor-domain-containing protein [Dactylonectria macrodidyma]|uniref:CP2 transcription factor-domain-containing protein n=1 Tax=Dactylonectria macrodidyma TaxID=307937 RepID=A0A9P9F9F9_9HYPO|nr:CP2 transcription factor-domain-containing protein [Dactylonectria macrodidyma]
MFRQRTSSQKPGDDLLADFRQQFPQVAAVSTATTAPAISQTVAAENPIVHAPPQPERAQGITQDVFRDQDPTPRATNEPWRFTPSLLDPNSLSFANFANAPPGYYTPTPGGTNTLFHHQAGDLHTPTLGFGMGLGTPLSMPTSGEGMHAVPGTGPMDIAGFQAFHSQQFHQFNPFIQAPPPQPAFAPSSFVHQDTGYETMDQDAPPMDSKPPEEPMPMDPFQNSTAMIGLQTRPFTDVQASHPLPTSAEKFRFHSTLNAPTAMIKQADEVPITYLNKGQAYSLSVTDTNATLPIVPGTKYRTFVRVSFEDDQQRQRPGVCWGLWKEGRGTNEAHQRGGKLQAVEYVEAGQPIEGDDKRTRMELESSSFDGFSVIWTPGTNGACEANIAVRFNFLSTDFSHSKGVKGIPVRLCAKTSPVTSDGLSPTADAKPEICFCKVKLFRDHGAERKLSNDVAHVKKSIDKLKQQIAPAESGMKDFGKRKRSSAGPKAGEMHRPGKVIKHKRTWSMSSASSAGGGRVTMEEDLHFKLQTLQDMFTSTRPVSVLYLRGEEHDDPDLHPVSLPGDASPLTKTESRDGTNWQARSGRSSITGSMISPSPSSLSLASHASAIGPGGQWQNFDSVAVGDTSRKGSDPPTKVNKTDDDGNLSGWIEALDVDPSYRPPLERAPKPVACFYVRRHTQEGAEQRNYHRAIYLTRRTLKDFNDRLAAKWGFDPARITRTTRSLQNGLEVELDDDVIRELKEGQDMVLQIEEVEQSPGAKREWEMAVDSNDGSPDTQLSDETGGYVLRLVF